MCLNFYKGLSKMVVVAAVTLYCVSGYAQHAKTIDSERMNKDLNIMEGILGKLLNAEERLGISSGEPVGVFLEDYGVVFHVNKKNDFLSVINIDVMENLEWAMKKGDKDESEEKMIVVAPKSDVANRPESEESAKKQLSSLKDGIIEFLGNYADAIGQLQQDDRITVLVDLSESNRLPGVPMLSFQKEKQKKPVAMLEISATKKDILAFRTGKLNTNTFRKKVSVTEKTADEMVNKHIEILAEILETALGRKYQRGFSAARDARGIYLKGLGALFFLHGKFRGTDFPVDVFEEYARAKDAGVVVQKQRKHLQQTREESVTDFKNNLIEVLGSYGHTLRTLSPEEFVVVSVDFNSMWEFRNRSPERFLVKVKKGNLDAYNAGSLTLADFKKRVLFKEY